MAYTPAEWNAARSMVQMGQSGMYAYTQPPAFSAQPLSSAGQPKIWVSQPYAGAFGMSPNPHWQSPMAAGTTPFVLGSPNPNPQQWWQKKNRKSRRTRRRRQTRRRR